MNKLLIIAPSSKDIYQDLATDHSAIETNIWAGLLANAVRNLCDVQILDQEVLKYNVNELRKDITGYNPDFVLFVVTGQNPNSSSSSMAEATVMASVLDQECESKYPIGFVGPHVNALPVQTLEKHQSIKFCLTNEGVYALKDLVSGGINDLGSVKGLAYRDDNGDIQINHPAAVVPQERLEIDLPGVAYDLMPELSSYRTSHWHANYSNDRSPFASVYTSLGCSFVCNFCMINIINRTENGENKYAGMFNKFRHWNPEFTIKQLDYLADKGVKNIKIADELFLNSPKKHAMPLCDLIIDRGYDFRIWCYSRINTIRDIHLDKLRRAGVNYLALGVESFSQSVRQEVEKGKFVDLDIVSVIKMIEDAGIHVINNMIVGLPGETIESAEENFQFAQEMNCSAYNIYPAMALPGSQLYVEALTRGERLPQEYSEFGFLSYDCVPLSNGIMTPEDMLRIRDDNWMRYHTSEKFLNSIQTKFGQSAVDNINNMTKIKLKRKLLGD